MISLDTFRKYRYSDIIKGNIDIKKCDYDEDVYEKPLTDQMLRDRLAFLSLFVTETVDEAIAIQNIFPELSEIFNEMNEYLARPEEVLGMFSEALRILNHNTAVLMVDEYRKKYQEMEKNLNIHLFIRERGIRSCMPYLNQGIWLTDILADEYKCGSLS